MQTHYRLPPLFFPMKNIITLLASILLLLSCGGDDDNQTTTGNTGGGGGGTTGSNPPKVVSTSPADGAIDIPIGSVDISIVYNQTIRLTSNNTSGILMEGGTVKSLKLASNTTAYLTVDCPSYDTKVNITIPRGMVSNLSAEQSEAYSFSFTTTSKPTSKISKTPIAATTTTAQKLYSYFLDQYGQKTISSVMAEVNWNKKCADKIQQLTGKYPAMNCYDFIHIHVPNQSSTSWINYSDITPVSEWHNAGGIVQLMWHFNVPLTETTEIKNDGSGVTCSPDKTTFKASNALVSSTWENKWFYEQMDKVIAVVLKLQEAGIAATWRPFHEAAGNATAKQQASWTKAWFWWGYDGAETYKRLWIAMFEYFKEKGVQNLIWIWTTQNYNGNSSQYNLDSNWYPGDQYVDMVARDLYGYNATQNQQEFSQIQDRYPTKMVVLGECGHGDKNEAAQPGDSWSAGAKWGHFMVWYQGEQGSTDTMCSDAWWKAAMNDPSVITREQLPNLK